MKTKALLITIVIFLLVAGLFVWDTLSPISLGIVLMSITVGFIFLLIYGAILSELSKEEPDFKED